MRKCLLILLLLSMPSLICHASQATSCSFGEITFSVDLGAPNLSLGDVSADGTSVGYDVSAGLGLGLGAQYSYTDIRMKNSINNSDEIKVQQFTLMHNIQNLVGDLSVFGGVSQTDVTGGTRQYGVLIGLAGDLPIAANTKTYGVVTTGSNISGYEFGVKYKFVDNANISLGYRNTRYKNITFNNGTTSNMTLKGLVGGINFWF
jgi:hypothetical protein